MGLLSKVNVSRVLKETVTWEIFSVVVLVAAITLDPLLSVDLAKGLAYLALAALICGICLILRLLNSLDLI
jgi:hypothetical protein